MLEERQPKTLTLFSRGGNTIKRVYKLWVKFTKRQFIDDVTEIES